MRSVRSWPTERSKGTEAGRSIDKIVWGVFVLVALVILI